MVAAWKRDTQVEPILASWKISEVLKRYPDLLDVLVSLSPAFKQLRNPVLRRVQSRLVTVSQAAAIAGMEPAALVRALNEAIGVAPPTDAPSQAAEAAPDEAPPWVETADVVVDLDVRPYQDTGEEPFSAIMATARKVPVGSAFRLRNTFEPTPLYDVLGARGFGHWPRQVAEDHWEILFFNAGSPRATEKAPAPDPVTGPTADATLDWDTPTEAITIDVSDLVPPEPMIRILEAVEGLAPGGTLLVHHVRRPMHLYPRLDALGCRHETRDLGPGRVQVLIEKPLESGSGA